MKIYRVKFELNHENGNLAEYTFNVLATNVESAMNKTSKKFNSEKENITQFFEVKVEIAHVDIL